MKNDEHQTGVRFGIPVPRFHPLQGEPDHRTVEPLTMQLCAALPAVHQRAWDYPSGGVSVDNFYRDGVVSLAPEPKPRLSALSRYPGVYGPLDSLRKRVVVVGGCGHCHLCCNFLLCKNVSLSLIAASSEGSPVRAAEEILRELYYTQLIHCSVGLTNSPAGVA